VSDSFLDRFSGIARLYGTAALERFRAARVVVVGVGGVGSWSAESLARSGIGTLVLVDPDDLCVTNTNRQIHALDGSFGRPKTAALAARLRAIQPGIRIVEHQDFFSERTADAQLDPAPDAVVDAIDSLRAKCSLLAHCHRRSIPVIASGAAGGRRDPTRIRVDDLSRSLQDPLLAGVRKKLRAEFGFPKADERGRGRRFGIEAIFSDEPPLYPTCEGEVSSRRPEDLPGGLRCDAGYGSATHVTATFGLIAAGRVLEWLERRASDRQGPDEEPA
jgi:tRNA A37 threonylcarbamoyladenosine dehydratase